MTHFSALPKLFTAALIIMFLSGCISTTQMAVSPELESNSEVMTPIGRSAFSYSKPFSLGEYQVRDIKKGWTTGSGLNLQINRLKLNGPYNKHTRYEFNFDTNSTESWKSECRFSKQGVRLGLEMGLRSLGFFTRKTSLYCTFESNEKQGISELTLSETHDLLDYLAGNVIIDGKEFKLKGTGKTKNSSIPQGTPVGFEFYQNDQIVATVQTLGNGTVWVHDSLDYHTRTQISVVSSALLLYGSLGSTKD